VSVESGEFRKEAAGRRADVAHIEYLLRRGRKQLAMLDLKGVTAVHMKRTAH
jgi:hypothetical protein